MNGDGKIVKLNNRDGVSMWLESNEEGYYTLETNGDSFYKEHFRIIGNNINKPEAIDPPGGPFISVGNVYDGFKVKEITFPPLRFYLEKDGKSL